MRHYYKKSFIFLLFISIGFNIVFAQNNNDESFSSEHLEQDAKEKSYDIGIEIEQNVDTSLLVFLSNWLGVVYRYGGSSTNGTDCSGFVNNCYNIVYHRKLPRRSIDIFQKTQIVDKLELTSGDLVFFKTLGSSVVNHVGVYLWNGYFAHASSKRGVVISKLDEGYYQKTFVGGGYFRPDL